MIYRTRQVSDRPDKDAELRKMAEFEYDQSRRGIEKYDDHLFRIRQWNIGLSAAALAAILGFVNADLASNGPGKTAAFSPSLALFVFTAITFAFWLLDALNKSLQTVHIHNNRDIERYLRGAVDTYVGPTISLRYHRKHKRHWVGTVKNLTDESVIWFYLFPIIIFWVAVILKFRPAANPFSDARVELSWTGVCTFFTLLGQSASLFWDTFSVNRTAALLGILGIGLLMFLSHRWKHGPRTSAYFPWSKFFLRFKAARRRRAYVQTFERLHKLARCTCAHSKPDDEGDKPCVCDPDKADDGFIATPCDCLDRGDVCECKQRYGPHFVSPFRADFYNPETRTLLFIDRQKLARSPMYLVGRQEYFAKQTPKMTAYYAKWHRPQWGKVWHWTTRWITPWRPKDIPDEELLEFLGKS